MPLEVPDASFTFIDLFAGIGGTRLGFEKYGGKCIFTSEWDKYSIETYKANFDINHSITGDINDVIGGLPDSIPGHNVLLAGFPCQPFSIAGVSKKRSLGRPDGFSCQDQGNLFFRIADILDKKKPEAFLLENVKNLKGHDKGKTFQIITETLENELNYNIFPRIIDAKGMVPQHRERIFIVGFREETDFSWSDLQLPDPRQKMMRDILHPEDGSEIPEEPYTNGKKGIVNSKYILSNKLWKYLQEYARKHRERGNGFGFGLVEPDDISRTLSARYYKDGSEILVSRGENQNPRRLTPRECSRLMGYDDSFEIPVSDTRAYQQFGNSVVVPVIEEIARIMKKHIISLM